MAVYILVSMFAFPTKAAEPRVVASIPPVHSLVASILDGITSPQLILEGFASPHSYAMTPSEATMLANADIIFWVGPDLEGFLIKSLKNLNNNTRIVALGREDVPANVEQDNSSVHEHTHHHGDADPHFWLDPEKALRALQQIADVITDTYPEHRSKIAANLDKAIATINKLNYDIMQLLEPVRHARAVVLHDAYGHFTTRFGMPPFLALTLTPEKKPGPVQLKMIRKEIKEHNIKCVFREPQFPKRYTNLLTEGSAAEQATLDPLGGSLEPGPNLYSELMMQLAKELRDCLQS